VHLNTSAPREAPLNAAEERRDSNTIPLSGDTQPTDIVMDPKN